MAKPLQGLYLEQLAHNLKMWGFIRNEKWGNRISLNMVGGVEDGWFLTIKDIRKVSYIFYIINNNSNSHIHYCDHVGECKQKVQHICCANIRFCFLFERLKLNSCPPYLKRQTKCYWNKNQSQCSCQKSLFSEREHLVEMRSTFRKKSFSLDSGL